MAIELHSYLQNTFREQKGLLERHFIAGSGRIMFA